MIICLATSRSTSPSSRLYSISTLRQTGTIPKKNPVIPRSLVNSRETSPTRNGHQSVRRLGYPRRPERPPIIPSRPILAQKMLQASREAETALADALVIFSDRIHMWNKIEINIHLFLVT